MSMGSAVRVGLGAVRRHARQYCCTGAGDGSRRSRNLQNHIVRTTATAMLRAFSLAAPIPADNLDELCGQGPKGDGLDIFPELSAAMKHRIRDMKHRRDTAMKKLQDGGDQVALIRYKHNLMLPVWEYQTQIYALLYQPSSRQITTFKLISSG